MMGWTSYPVEWCCQKRGKVDRKAEIDKVYGGETEAARWTVLRSAMVGSTWYGAVKVERKDTGVEKVFAGVCLTSIEKGEFYYKDMTDDMGPYKYDCPKGILDLLSPTDNEYANSWREECRKRIVKRAEKSALGALPIGTKIEFDYNGQRMWAVKHEPAFQFKTPFWMTGSRNYISKKRIPLDYRVVDGAAGA